MRLPRIAGPISYYATHQQARSLQSEEKLLGSFDSGAGAGAVAQPASNSWWIPADASLQAEAAAPAQVFRLLSGPLQHAMLATCMYLQRVLSSLTTFAETGKWRHCSSKPC